jgi:hypothetical protein
VDEPEVGAADAGELDVDKPDVDEPDVDVSSSIVAAVFSKVERHC